MIEKEIAVYHLKRSGSHGIMGWLQQALNQERETISIPSVGKFIDGIGNSTKNLYDLGSDFVDLNGKNVMYAFESQHGGLVDSWKKIPFLTDIKKHEKLFGKSKLKYNVLILRDPYNCLSSRISKTKNGIFRKSNLLKWKQYPYGYNNFKKMWLTQAKEFVGETDYLDMYNRIPISYNEWFLNKGYRKYLCSLFGVEYTDKGLNNVKGFGGGSSFSGVEYNGRAQDMDVLNRWKKNKNHPFMKDMLNDMEVKKYSDMIFGHITD